MNRGEAHKRWSHVGLRMIKAVKANKYVVGSWFKDVLIASAYQRKYCRRPESNERGHGIIVSNLP